MSAVEVDLPTLRFRFGDCGKLPSECFVIDRDDSEHELISLSGEIKELEHGRADRPLVSDQSCDHVVGIAVASTGNQFSSAVLGVEITADLAHPLVVTLDRPVGIFIFQFNAVESTAFEGE